MSDLGKLCYSKVDGMSLCFSKKNGSLIYKGEKQVDPEPGPEPEPDPEPAGGPINIYEPFVLIRYGTYSKIAYQMKLNGELRRDRITENYEYNKYDLMSFNIIKYTPAQGNVYLSHSENLGPFSYTEIRRKIYKDKFIPENNSDDTSYFDRIIDNRFERTRTIKNESTPNNKIKLFYSIKNGLSVAKDIFNFQGDIISETNRKIETLYVKGTSRIETTNSLGELKGMSDTQENQFTELEPIGNNIVIPIKQDDLEIKLKFENIDIWAGVDNYLGICIHLDNNGRLSHVHSCLAQTQEEAESLIND